eukprot:4639250-Prymnesium_polylepis.1
MARPVCLAVAGGRRRRRRWLSVGARDRMRWRLGAACRSRPRRVHTCRRRRREPRNLAGGAPSRRCNPFARRLRPSTRPSSRQASVVKAFSQRGQSWLV